MLPMGTRLAWNCVVLILLYSITSGFASPGQHVLEKHEVAPSNNFTLEMKIAFQQVIDFFRPMTCNHKDKKPLIPCHVGEDLNTTECLENKCCPSTTSDEPMCYMPLKDNMQLAFRVLVLVAGGLLIMGCLPFFCCACLQR
ncbi:FMR1N protein, partial [Alcedo cyanopectus]|nr:FMR1N protein [Ceyx cyanopectus]